MTDEEKQKICMECQACCKYIGYLCGPTPQEANFLAAWGYELTPVAGTGKLTATIYHPCQHITDKGCDIYDTRPIFCREYYACDDPALAHLCKLKPSEEA